MPLFATEVVSQPVLNFLRSNGLTEMAAMLEKATTTKYGVVILAGLGSAAVGRVVQANDPRLSDSRSPTAHANSHKDGASDALLLDELGVPTDNTNLDATTLRHGLMSKLDKVKLNSIVPGTYPAAIDAVAGVVLGSNTMVHINSSGEAIKADATLDLPAHGLVKAAAGIGDPVFVYQIGQHNGFAGLSVGDQYYLAANGQITATAPSFPSVVSQPIGIAVASDTLALDIDTLVELLP